MTYKLVLLLISMLILGAIAACSSSDDLDVTTGCSGSGTGDGSLELAGSCPVVSGETEEAQTPTFTTVPKPEPFSILTSDGIHIVGNHYPPMSLDPLAPVVLMHMLNSDQTTWSEFVEYMQGRGHSVFTFDFRGHRSSTTKSVAGSDGTISREIIDVSEFKEDEFIAFGQDLKAVMQHLRTHAGGDKVALVGASIGANVALSYAPSDPQIGKVVLLSPGRNYRGVTIDFAARSVRVPVLTIASEEDEYSATSSRFLDSLLAGEHELRIFRELGHGTDMFDVEPGLQLYIADWIEE